MCVRNLPVVAVLLLGCGHAADSAASVATSAGGAAASASASDAATGGARASVSASSGAGGAGGGATHGGGGAGFTCLPASGFGGGADGGGGGACASPPRFATRVVEACIGPNGGFGEDDYPGNVLGPPKGGGASAGSLDVLGLGEGGSIVLAFDGGAIVDGPGVDFIVFENPFYVNGDPMDVYANPGTVSVSDDGVTWTSFPCTAKHYPWGQCAGWHPVYANADTNTIDPLDPQTAGGDAFDLHDISIPRARYVKITDRADLPGDFDLDAIAVVNAGCP